MLKQATKNTLKASLKKKKRTLKLREAKTNRTARRDR